MNNPAGCLVGRFDCLSSLMFAEKKVYAPLRIINKASPTNILCICHPMVCAKINRTTLGQGHPSPIFYVKVLGS